MNEKPTSSYSIRACEKCNHNQIVYFAAETYQCNSCQKQVKGLYMTTQPDVPENYSFSPQCMNCHTIVTNIRSLIGQQVHRWTCSNCGEKCVGHFSKANGKWNWALEKHEDLTLLPADIRRVTNVAEQKPVYENELLNERQKTHGDFAKTAQYSQRFKALFIELAEDSETALTDVMEECFDSMSTKFARIFAGNERATEHWDDLAGYPELVIKDLEKSK